MRRANFCVSQCGDRTLPVSQRGKSRSSSLARPIPRDSRSSCILTKCARNSAATKGASVIVRRPCLVLGGLNRKPALGCSIHPSERTAGAATRMGHLPLLCRPLPETLLKKLLNAKSSRRPRATRRSGRHYIQLARDWWEMARQGAQLEADLRDLARPDLVDRKD